MADLTGVNPATSQIMNKPVTTPVVNPDPGSSMDRGGSNIDAGMPAAPNFAANDAATAGSNIDAAYAPLIANLAQQKTDAIQRTAQNAADIKNIFGTLSTIRQQDAIRIADQFKSSLMMQQQALAGRTAEARTGLTANQQAVQQAGAELGGGPTQMPTDSLTSQAVNQGIAGANQYQTVWEGLQGAMQGQTQQNLQNAISGYGYQQADTVRQMQQSLNNTLQGISAQEAQVQTSIGQSKLQAQQALAEMQAEAAQKTAALQNALAVAQINAKGKTDAAKIAAAARVAARTGSGSSSTSSSTAGAKNFTDWSSAVSKATNGVVDGNAIANKISDAYTTIMGARNNMAGLAASGQTKTRSGKPIPAGYKAKAPTTQELYTYMKTQYPNLGPYLSYIKDYLNKYY